jgi:hypothetical protein
MHCAPENPFSSQASSSAYSSPLKYQVIIRRPGVLVCIVHALVCSHITTSYSHIERRNYENDEEGICGADHASLVVAFVWSFVPGFMLKRQLTCGYIWIS